MSFAFVLSGFEMIYKLRDNGKSSTGHYYMHQHHKLRVHGIPAEELFIIFASLAAKDDHLKMTKAKYTESGHRFLTILKSSNLV